MRKLLNTLYILQEDVFLKLDGLNVIVTKSGNTVARVPFCNIENIVCFNYLGCSPALMAKCSEEGVGLSFLKPSGEFLARVIGKVHGNVHLRVSQFEKLKQEEVCLYLAKCTIKAKLNNTIEYLKKRIRDDVTLTYILEKTINTISALLEQIDNIDNLDTLRGIEGTAAKEYFDIFNQLLKNEDFTFKVRTKRPPLDPINAMLSYLYTLLALDCQSALETVGLDPYVGYFHTDRSGRASLALDIMEEFRCFIVDRCVLSLVNKKQITKNHFEFTSSGAVVMNEEGKKIILKEWQNRKKEEIKHPILNEKVCIGLLPYVQARILSKYLREDEEKYKTFVVKL